MCASYLNRNLSPFWMKKITFTFNKWRLLKWYYMCFPFCVFLIFFEIWLQLHQKGIVHLLKYIWGEICNWEEFCTVSLQRRVFTEDKRYFYNVVQVRNPNTLVYFNFRIFQIWIQLRETTWNQWKGKLGLNNHISNWLLSLTF